MQITSEHYRRASQHGYADDGLAGCWSRIVNKLAQASQQAGSCESLESQPLAPSEHTLRDLRRHYTLQHHSQP